MKEPNVYDRIRARTKPETKRYVQKNAELARRVAQLLKARGWTQKEFARALGKSESEVSKWLSGLHNLTLKSIAKMEAVLEADLLVAPDLDIDDSKPFSITSEMIYLWENSDFNLASSQNISSFESFDDEAAQTIAA